MHTPLVVSSWQAAVARHWLSYVTPSAPHTGTYSRVHSGLASGSHELEGGGGEGYIGESGEAETGACSGGGGEGVAAHSPSVVSSWHAAVALHWLVYVTPSAPHTGW